MPDIGGALGQPSVLFGRCLDWRTSFRGRMPGIGGALGPLLGNIGPVLGGSGPVLGASGPVMTRPRAGLWSPTRP